MMLGTYITAVTSSEGLDVFRFFFNTTDTYVNTNIVAVLCRTNRVSFGRICTEFRVLPLSADFRSSMLPP